MSGCAVIYVSSFPPRKCGIATFTQDLASAIDDILAPAVQSRIVAMNAEDPPTLTYPEQVIFQIQQENLIQYRAVARKINRLDEVQLINVQHEFGLHGGDYGANLLAFLDVVKKPVVITFHTILPEPEAKLYRMVKALSAKAAGIVVPTYYSRKILFEEYGIPEGKVSVIPHGIPPYPFRAPGSGKSALGFSGKTVLSTFGLLSRGKGLEYVISALPEVVRRYPRVIYNILGSTHPNIIKEEGESYREFLEQRVNELELTGNVNFYNRYFPVDELLKYLEATDIYISPSLDPNQAVSGTLSYALGMGRPVISTAFAQAREYVTADVGILVDFGSPQSYTDAMIRLLEDSEWRMNLGRNAYFRSRRMIWPNVAIRYLRCFSGYAPKIAELSWQKNLPAVKIDHLLRLTDDFGIFQFARLAEADPSSGYTLDDNARALIAAVMCYERLGGEAGNGADPARKRDLLKLSRIYLNFIQYVAKPDGRFSNYVKSDRALNHTLNRKEDPDDANGRAFYALCFASVSKSLPAGIRSRAFRLCRQVLDKGVTARSLRAMAFHIKGLGTLLEHKRRIPGINIVKLLTGYADSMVAIYQSCSSADWPWFEDCLTYSNAVLPESLLLAYRVTGNESYLRVGKECLDFLIKEGFMDGDYTPVGQEGWHHRYGRRSRFDQQPIDVAAMVLALKVCNEVTNDQRHLKLMRQAFNWFLGDNVSCQVIYDHTTGGCCDGLGEKQVNLNEGAESTSSYLIARLSMFDLDLRAPPALSHNVPQKGSYSAGEQA